MSTVSRASFSEVPSGIHAVSNTTSNIHQVPAGALDEIWMYLSSASSTTATVTLGNTSYTATVDSTNSPLTVIPGVTCGEYLGEFNPNATSTVFSIVRQSDGKIILSGGFTFVGGVARNRIARVGGNGSLGAGGTPAPFVRVSTAGQVTVSGYVNRIQ